MNTPRKFLRARHQNKIKKIAAEVIRMTDAMSGPVPRNPEVANITIPVYRKMLRDSEVSSSLTLKELLMIPTLRVIEPDGDEKSKKSVEFIKAVEKKMPGSPISVYRNQALHEALTTGMILGEPNFIKTEIPGFGWGKGLESITIANSQDFVGNTKMDEYGKIEKFVQSRSGSDNFTPEQVLYYGYKAITGSPEGVSALFPAHDPWKLKLTVFRNLAVFVNTNASGISKIKIPRDFFKAEKEDALTFLRELAENARIAMPDDWDLGFDIPPAHAGLHFVKIIQEICNKSIRKAILYDETITAESLHSWKSGTDIENQNMVIETMKAEGEEFAESFIQEQLYRRILDANDMQDYPTPYAVTGYAIRKKDPAVVLSAMGKAKTDGILDRVSLPVEAQAQLVSEMLDSMGVVCDPLQVEVIVPDTNAPDEFKRVRLARLQANEVISGLWDENLPSVIEALDESLSKVYDDGNYGVIREIVEKTITTGGGKFRKSLIDINSDDTQSDGSVSNSAYISLKKGYCYLTEKIYAELDDSIKNKLNYDNAIERIKACLAAQKADFISVILERGDT